MNKFLFIIFSIFTLVHSSIIWTPDELAKYINENYELGDTLLFDDKSYITDEHREKINAIMKRITNQNDVFVYGIFLDEINLNSYRIDVFFERMVMPLSLSRSLLSITRSSTTSLVRKVPLWRSISSTSVVLPWSTCAIIAMFFMFFLVLIFSPAILK